jgi:Major Facilitator Superfamily
MARRLSAPSRLVAASLIDWTGTGFYVAVSAIFLTRSVGLTPGQAGLALAGVGVLTFAGSVHVGRLGDRFGHRDVLLALHVIRAAGFTSLALVDDLYATLAVLGVIGLADQAASGMTQALASQLAGEEGRLALMGRLRVVTNIGITLGTIPAGIALAAPGDPFGVLLTANAASYLGAAALVVTLPRAGRSTAPWARWRLLVPSAPTAALISVDGLMSMWRVVLNVGLPLWILQATAASPALVAVLYGTNTVLAVLLQPRVSRALRTYARAARAVRASGLLLAACCVCLAASVLGGRAVSTAFLVAAVVCLTLAEMLKVAAAWQITYTLAPAGRSAEFFATYGLGGVATEVLGPVLVTSVVLALGSAGWLALAAVFVLAGAVMPPAARRALARPVAARRGRGGPPAQIARMRLLRGLCSTSARPSFSSTGGT